MRHNIIGRGPEVDLLERLYQRKEAEFLALYGRRRVGKTFLINEFFEKRGFYFSLTGEKDASRAVQLQNFVFAFGRSFPEETLPSSVDSWSSALQLLATALEKRRDTQKIILFFDELPWLASRKSGFMQALDHFWNSWGVRQKNLLVVVCGSAASWMINELLHNKGGLYNRVTASICLSPFSVREVEKYLKSRGISLARKDIVELYMCLGGVPHYLHLVERGDSVAQTIDKLCFSNQGLLAGEFDRLFSSLFSNSEIHDSIVRVLAKKRSGSDRKTILKQISGKSGGGITRALRELEQSGFVSCAPQFGKRTRGRIYRLTDEYSLFYLTFIERAKGQTQGYWQHQRHSRSFNSWAGFSFESVWLKHIDQIKRGLQIGAVHTTHSGWYGDDKDKAGHQIDLVIDRADNCINLCEIKFSEQSFHLSKKIAEDLMRKAEGFKSYSQTRKTVFTTLITTYGCKQNDHYDQVVDSELTMEALFREF